MDRRRLLQSAGRLLVVTAASGLPGHRPPALPVDPNQVDQLTAAVRQLRLQDAQRGAVSVLPKLSMHADHLLRMLAATRPGTPLSRRVAAAASDAAGLAGWLEYDQGAVDAALRWYARAERAAAAAEDADQLGAAMGMLARIAFQHDDVDGGMRLLYRIPLRQASPLLTAYADGMRAEGLARLGREYDARKALDRARTAAQRPVETSLDPQLQGFIRSSLAGNTSRLDVHLGRAAAGYEQRLRQLGSQAWLSARTPPAMHVGLAEAALAMGDVPLAAHHAGEAGEAFVQVDSVRHVQKVAKLRAALEAHADHPAVRELDERLHAASDADGPRYVRVKSYNSRHEPGRPLLLVHRSDCPMARRSTRARPWPEADGRAPAELAADPEVRAGHRPCGSCLGRLWT